MAGYSKRTLVEKLGIQEGFRVALVDPPADYRVTLGSLPKDAVEVGESPTGLNFVQYFVCRAADLEQRLPKLKKRLLMNGRLWISWPKGSSGVETDVNENVVRRIALENDLVDVKVCAVDNTWSGLKLVYRLRDRTATWERVGKRSRKAKK